MKRFAPIEIVVLSLIVLCIVAMLFAVPASRRERATFMATCSHDRPEYECQAMWAQMHPDPVVVLAPLNR